MIHPIPAWPLEFQGIPLTQDSLIALFQNHHSWEQRYRLLLQLAKLMPPLAEEDRCPAHQVHGCESQVWLKHTCKDGCHWFTLDSDARLIRGLLTVLLVAVNGKYAESIKGFNAPDFLTQLGLAKHLSSSRTNGLNAVWQAMQATTDQS